MKPPYAIGGTLLAALVVYGLGRWDQHGNDNEARWAEHASFALRMGQAYRKLQKEGDRKLQNAQGAAQASAGRAKRAIAAVDSLEGQIKGLEGQLGGMTSGEDSLTTWRGLYEKRTRQQMQTTAALTARTEERDQLQVQVGVLTVQRDSARARVIQLDSVVAAGLNVKQCRIAGFIHCPSRTGAFVAGGVTVVAVREVVKALLPKKAGPT